MCCIIFCENARPSEALLERALKQNSDGSGVCWREGGAVHWAKGLSDKQILKMAKDLPFPFAIHVRMATVGGKSDAMAHPFPIEPIPRLDLTGTAKHVLMHNGHHTNWDMALDVLGVDMSKEKWSDSRAIAHILAVSGPKVLKHFSPSRFLIFGSETSAMVGAWHDQEGCKLSSSVYTGEVKTCSYGGYGIDRGYVGRHGVVGGGKTETIDPLPHLSVAEKEFLEKNFARTKSGLYVRVTKPLTVLGASQPQSQQSSPPAGSATALLPSELQEAEETEIETLSMEEVSRQSQKPLFNKDQADYLARLEGDQDDFVGCG